MRHPGPGATRDRPYNPRMSEARVRDPRLLGDMKAQEFLRLHWQKKHRLIKAAIPGFQNLLQPRELLRLAERDDVESRLVVKSGRDWTLKHGPFRRGDFRGLPPRGWTLLVQGLNLVLPAAEMLLRRFDFLPYARLDDLMVSYAVPGGGVGPHFDSYDVFLLQGMGRRRWRVGTQQDLALRDGLPVKILRRFRPEHEWTLQGGDMLYLPPRYAHDGIAVDECTTYSIGFRASSAEELAVAWLDHLRDTVRGDDRYADPGLQPTTSPARLSPELIRKSRALVESSLPGCVRDGAEFVAFLGRFLTEPKPHVFFEPPDHRASDAALARRFTAQGVRLDSRTGMLYDTQQVYVNGEAEPYEAAEAVPLRELANRRALAGYDAKPLLAKLTAWYRSGYLHPGADAVDEPIPGSAKGSPGQPE
jgi:50S ribosomal protein L16 3-hydroxylase